MYHYIISSAVNNFIFLLLTRCITYLKKLYHCIILDRLMDCWNVLVPSKYFEFAAELYNPMASMISSTRERITARSSSASRSKALTMPCSERGLWRRGWSYDLWFMNYDVWCIMFDGWCVMNNVGTQRAALIDDGWCIMYEL